MLKPLTTMVRVLLLILIIVSARTYSKANIVCVNHENEDLSFTDISILSNEFIVLTSSLVLNNQTIPDYLQFSCIDKDVSIRVEITVETNEVTNIITEDIIIDNSNSQYEIPLLTSLKEELNYSNAIIKSILIYNTSNYPITLKEIKLIPSSTFEEIKLNQVVNIAIQNQKTPKKYFVTSELNKAVTLKVYNNKGLLIHKDVSTINKGNNVIQFDQINLAEGNFLVVISENNKYSFSQDKQAKQL